jgi:3-hydroxyisobutyrate dehydrogenase-like beta-hydroxyacid dehydrogenase
MQLFGRKDRLKSLKLSVGVIGLGIMGGAMARALIGAGFAVCGYDPATAASRRMRRAGGAPLVSSTAVADRADVLVTSLPTSDALEDAVEAIARAKRRPAGRRVLIETSTLPLADKRRARTRLARAGWTALDCPISGTAVRLKERAWTIFASGDKRALERVGPVLEVFTDNVPYVGGYGDGIKMKFIANHLVAILNVASAEAITFARRMRLDPRRVLELFGASPVVGTGVLRLRGRFMVERRYRPATMKVEVWQKDMRVIGDMARAVGAPTPLFSACAPVFDEAMAQGYADADTASVYEVLGRAAGRARHAG